MTPIAPADTAAAAGATHRAAGTLTMAGRSNRVSFPLTVTVDAGRVTADADFIIDRQEWGLTWRGAPDDLVSDEVRVRLHVVAPVAPAQ
jgi:polyisoprenoid-binding protein YceI